MRNRRREWTLYGGGSVGLAPELQSVWYPALRSSGASRAVASFIGDSITEGHASTDFDTTSFVALLRASLQALYGNGGEGFISPLHTSDPLETGWAASPTARWTFASGTWTLPDALTLNGWGAIGGAAYWANSTVDPQITFTGDTLQIMTGIKFNATARNLVVKVDGGTVATIDLAGGLADQSLFAPGTIYEYTGLAAGSHALLLDTTATFPFLEGVRPLIGTTGVVLDRYAKSGLQAAWLGTVNDSDPSGTNYQNFFKALYSTVDAIPAHLYVIMLGTNDYVAQVALNTFETALTTVVNRCLVRGNVAIVSPPQPNSSLTIPMSSYVTRMQTVASATGAAFYNLHARWGGIYTAGMMGDATHPNDAGHQDIHDFLLPYLRL